MKKYKCIKPFWVAGVDFYESETEIKAGEIYESDYAKEEEDEQA